MWHVCRVFFRRYYPLESVTYCGLDSQDRRFHFVVSSLFCMLVHVVASDSDYPFDAYCCHMGTAI